LGVGVQSARAADAEEAPIKYRMVEDIVYETRTDWEFNPTGRVDPRGFSIPKGLALFWSPAEAEIAQVKRARTGRRSAQQEHWVQGC